MSRQTKSGSSKVATVAPSAPAATTFSDVLLAAGKRPLDEDATAKKKNYSQRLSENFAVLVANKLRATGSFNGILPHADGTGQESKSVSGAHKKLKKTDVRYGTYDGGLELLASIKTLNFKNSRIEKGVLKVGRYTKNMVRNDHELRAEAMEHRKLNRVLSWLDEKHARRVLGLLAEKEGHGGIARTRTRSRMAFAHGRTS